MGNLVFFAGSILSCIVATAWWLVTGHFPVRELGGVILGLLALVSVTEAGIYFTDLREDVQETRKSVAALKDEIASLRKTIGAHSA